MSLENHSILIQVYCGIAELPVIFSYPISRRPWFQASHARRSEFIRFE